MSPEIILIGLFAIPIVVLFLLRVNAAIVFLSLCLGSVLVDFAGNDLASFMAGASAGANTTESMVQIALLLLPALLTILFMIKTVRGKYKKFLNIIPSIGVGGLLVLLVVPQLSPAMQENITQIDLWQTVQGMQAAVVAVSAFVCLGFLLVMRPKAPVEDKHAKKH